MVTAAAGSDAAIVLVDITKIDWAADTVALLPQTRRHALLAHLLRVPSIVFAVNKIDALAEAEAKSAFDAVCVALQVFAADAGITVAAIVPVSALRGDNITRQLQADWYQGPTLLQLLESLPTTQERVDGSLLLPVQYVAREPGDQAEGTGHQPRTLWGRIAHGRIRAGEQVELFPSGQRATVVALRRAGSAVDAAEAGQSVGLILDRQLDVSRGDWIGTPQTLLPAQRFGGTLAWLDTEPAVVGRKYMVRHGNRWVQARIASIGHRLDIGTLAPTDAHELSVNDIGHVVVELQQPLPLEPYAHNRVAGSLIMVDPASNRTSGALLVNQVR
jgi:sulfate adenylyltransferase subunit 1